MGFFSFFRNLALVFGAYALLGHTVAHGETTLETIKQVKVGKKNVVLSYERDPANHKLRRLIVKDGDMRDVYEDTNGLGYFDSRLVLTKKSQVHFFNLYHGRFQNIELLRTGKLGILKLTLFFNERSGQYENLLKKYEPFKRMADTVDPDLSANCAKEIAQALSTPNASQLMEAAEVQGIGDNLFDASCKTGRFAPYYDDLVRAIAKITKTDKETNSKTFLACLQNHKMADVAEIIRNHLNNPVESKFQKMECKDDPSALAEYIPDKLNADKKLVLAHIEIYKTPPLPKISFVDEYASVIFHENLHAAGIISETRTKSIEDCCNGSIPDHDASCRTMDEITDQNHKVVAYGSSMQALDGFQEVWSKLSFGRQDNVAENMFAAFSDVFRKLDDKALAKADTCLRALPSGKKSTCFPAFLKVCERYSDADQNIDCNLRANDLAIVFQKNMETKCESGSNGKSCLASALDKANAIYAASLPDAKESFANLSLLQNRSPELVSANFVYQLMQLDSKDFGKLTESMKDQGDGVLDSVNYAFANFLRDQEELPGSQGAYENCISPRRGKALTKALVSSCLTAETTHLGASGAYQACKKENGMTDSDCTMISLGILKTELAAFAVQRKNDRSESECTKKVAGTNPDLACDKFNEAFQSVIHNAWVNCHIPASNNPSFSCLNDLVSGAIKPDAQGKISLIMAEAQKAKVATGGAGFTPEAHAQRAYISALNEAFPSFAAFVKESEDEYDADNFKKMMTSYFQSLRSWSSDVLQSYRICNEKSGDKNATCLDTLRVGFQDKSKDFFNRSCPSYYLGKKSIGKNSLSVADYCKQLSDGFMHTLDADSQRNDPSKLSQYRDVLICGDVYSRYNFDTKIAKENSDMSVENCKGKDTSSMLLGEPSTKLAQSYEQDKMDSFPGSSVVTAPVKPTIIATAGSAKPSSQQLRNTMLPSPLVLPEPTPADVGKIDSVKTGSVAVNPDSPSQNREVAINTINQASNVTALADKAVAKAVNTVVDAVVPTAYAAEEKTALAHDSSMPYAGGSLAPIRSSSGRRSNQVSSADAEDANSDYTNYSAPSSSQQGTDAASTPKRPSSSRGTQVDRSDYDNSTRDSQDAQSGSGLSHVNGITPSSTSASTGASSYGRKSGAVNQTKAGAVQDSSSGGTDSGTDSVASTRKVAAKRAVAARGSAGSSDDGVGLSAGSASAGGGAGSARGDSAPRTPSSINTGKTYSLDEIVNMAKSEPAKFSDMLDDKKFIDNLNQKEVLVMFKNHSLGTLSAKVVISFDAATNKYSVRRIGDGQ